MKEILSNTEYQQALSEQLIQQAYELMSAEFMSEGGNLRNKSIQEISDLLSSRGQLWVAHSNGEVLAAYTLELVVGTQKEWMYINNGVVAPKLRYQHSGIMDLLLQTGIKEQDSRKSFVVISVVWGMFEKLGFSKVSIEELSNIDESIAEIIKRKLRPDKLIHIGIKLANQYEH